MKGVIADHMGHFSVYDVPNVLFVLVSALVFGFLTALWGARATLEQAKRLAMWATVAALAAALVRSQLPLATLMLAAAVLVGKRSAQGSDIGLLSMLVIGIGCGSGASLIVGCALVLFIPILRWTTGGTEQAG